MTEKLLHFFINGREAEALPGSTVLEACLRVHVDIPHLCFNEMLKTSGVCGLCLVCLENKSSEPVLACKTAVTEGLHVFTDTASVKEARREKIRALLKTHPAGCTVCPRAGNCAIQKICFKYAPPDMDICVLPSREKIKISPLIECTPDKCISCRRCVNFLKEAGTPAEEALVPLKTFPASELSGNLLEFCPAAALTNATVKKILRSWELTRTDSIDVMDAVCHPVHIDSDGRDIVRILPRDADEIKGALISDKARFSFDGLRVNRLDRPYTRVDGRLKECSWTEAFMALVSKMKSVKPERMAALIGDFADCESMMALRDMMALAGAKAVDARPGTAYFDVENRSSWLFNTPFRDIAQADALLMIGVNLRRDAPAVNWLITQNPMPKAYIGEKISVTSACDFIGETPAVLEKILAGENAFSKTLEKAEKPMIIVGTDVLERPDAAAVMDLVYKTAVKYKVIRAGWNGYNLLHKKASVAGALELGLISETPLRPRIKAGDFDFVYLLNDDSVTRDDLADSFVVYQGIYAGTAAQSADILLPSLAYTEKRATYVNMAGIAQSTAVVLPPFGSAREDWKILRALSEFLGTVPLPYDDLDGVRDYLAGENIIFFERGKAHPADPAPFGKPGQPEETTFKTGDGFFDGDEICRQSATMQALKKAWEREGK